MARQGVNRTVECGVGDAEGMKPKDYLMMTLALLLRPSTIPLKSVFSPRSNSVQPRCPRRGFDSLDRLDARAHDQTTQSSRNAAAHVGELQSRTVEISLRS